MPDNGLGSSSFDPSATHASRNPTQPAIPPKKNTQTPTQASNKKLEVSIRRAETRQRHQALKEDVEAAVEEHNKKLREIAERHGQKERAVESMAKSKSVYAKTRGVSLYNAVLSAKAKELNAGRQAGDKTKLKDLNAAVAGDAKMQKILRAARESDSEDGDEERQEAARLIADVEEQRLLKSRGARSSNRAAAIDAAHTFGRIGAELANLEARTNARGFAVIARGHINDTVMPGYAGTSGAAEFAQDSLGVSMPQLVRKYEQFETARDRGAYERETRLRAMQKASAKMISDGLAQITGKKIQMNYRDYESAICQRYKVQIQSSWPAGVKFAKPSSINGIDDITKLHTALSTRQCAWLKMSPQEIEELNLRLQSSEPKQTKSRSDKGITRRRRRSNESDEGESDCDGLREAQHAIKKKRKSGKGAKRTGKLPPSVKTPAIVPTSSEEDEE